MTNNTKKTIKHEGLVLEALPNTMFKVGITDEHEVLCTLAGRMRKNYVRIFPGDRVRLETSPHDEERGRIIQKVR